MGVQRVHFCDPVGTCHPRAVPRCRYRRKQSIVWQESRTGDRGSEPGSSEKKMCSVKRKRRHLKISFSPELLDDNCCLPAPRSTCLYRLWSKERHVFFRLKFPVSRSLDDILAVFRSGWPASPLAGPRWSRSCCSGSPPYHTSLKTNFFISKDCRA